MDASVLPYSTVSVGVLWFMLISKMCSFENRPQRIDRKMYVEWDSSPCPHHRVTYTGFEFAAALHRKTGVEPLHYRSTVLNC